MSRFNAPTPSSKVINEAGGQSYKQSPELELVSILLTSFATDQFYKKADQTFDTLKNILSQVDAEFAAKAAVYARTKFGMRSITHVLASELARHVGGKEWAKEFYRQIVYRPDDMMEIVAYHKAKNGKITNAIRAGFALAFDKFDKYTLAKYRGESKGERLIDIVNTVHPVPTEKNAEAIAALVKGELKAFDTWESELSNAGQKAENEEELAELKKEVWVDLITTKKLGYFALLRNLRNIMTQAPDILDTALEQLVDERAIKKSLVLPFRFVTAFDQFKNVSESAARKIMVALNKAVDLSLSNVPKFEGETLVVLDVSDSMNRKKVVGDRTPAQIGALFAAILVKANNCDFMTFDADARYVNLNPADSTITLANMIRCDGGSTNFHAIFARASKRYDRIIILSDMQGWVEFKVPTGTYAGYKILHGANPKIYSFDLAGHGTMQFPEQNVFCLAGFSDKIFTIMGVMEQDKKALITEIKKISFTSKN